MLVVTQRRNRSWLRSREEDDGEVMLVVARKKSRGWMVMLIEARNGEEVKVKLS